MLAREKLEGLMKTRGTVLAREKAAGAKVVGYYPNEYFPEELALACGAIPLGLCRGGDYEPVYRSGAYVTRWMDTFCRAQVGLLAGKDDFYYASIDLYVAPIVEYNMRAMADCVNFFTTIPVFRFAIPRVKSERGYKYYLEGLGQLKERLENLTGNKVTDEKLREAIKLCNRERELLKEISLTRKSELLPITGREFINLVHLSYILDKKEMLEVLESYAEELKGREKLAKGPRIMLTGSELAWGDYQVIDFVEKMGGNVVIEQYCVALKDYWDNVDTDGDLLGNIARRYFMKKVPHMAFVPGKERHDLILKLAKEFNVDALIWYSPMYCDQSDIEFVWFEKRWQKEMGLPITRLDTEYDPYEKYDVGPVKTRVEVLLETIKS
jgi:benzoyl-CoA reductase/2-hydroxyglutaryl-CoA dehydratase subunit BcrC/BadD/HgdB